jgi:tetratricopeptide (TPR) repeat protein
MQHKLIAYAAAALLLAVPALAQLHGLPSDGGNQRASVTQNIGVVRVAIEYSSPDVHAPNGEDRRGKIWGELVPYGMSTQAFGTCGDQCPWRAGANYNTIFTVSHDVTVQGQPLKAGSYGLHMIPAKDADWTIIFSNDAKSWGSFFYDVKDDALRVTTKPAKSEYHEWLTYEFTDRQAEKATVALKWEELQVPFTIAVPDVASVHLAAVREELRDDTGFVWQNWVGAAQYALSVNRPKDALEFANAAVTRRFVGIENFQTLNTLATAQEANGLAEAKATREKAMNHPTANPTDLHQYARQLLGQGKKEEALRIWELNAKRHPNQWPVNVGLARGYSANGKYKEALKYAKLALAQAPDDVNKRNLEAGIKKLEAGQDMN